MLGFLDSLGDFDLLFAGEQGNLSHLLEIHANRVIENVESALARRSWLFLSLGLLIGIRVSRRLNVVDLCGIDDAKLHRAQSLDQFLH